MKIRNFLLGTFLLFLLFLLLITISLNLLPYYLQNHYLPEIAARNDLQLVSLQIDKVGLGKISISGLKIGTSKDKILSVDLIHLRFKPLSLHKREIQELSLSGVDLVVIKNKGDFSVAGLPTVPKKESPARKIETQDIQRIFSQLPVKIHKVSILNSSCKVELENNQITIPFELVLDSIDYDKTALAGRLSVLWLGKNIDVQGDANLSTNHFSVDVSSDKLPINLPADLLPGPKDVYATAFTLMEGQISGPISPFAPSYHATFVFENIFLQKNKIQFSSKSSPEEISPVRININGDLHGISTTISQLNMTQPYNILLKDLHFQTTFHNSGLTAAGGGLFLVQFNEKNKLTAPQTFHFAHKFRLNLGDDKWELIAETESPQESAEIEKFTFRSASETAKLSYALPKLFISGAGDKERGKIQYKAEARDFDLIVSSPSSDGPETTRKMTANRIATEGSLNLADLSGNPSVTGEIAFSGQNVSFSNDALVAGSDLFFAGNMAYNSFKATDPFTLNGLLQLKNGTATLPAQKITASAMSAAIPIGWPIDQAKTAQGEFAIKAIQTPEYDFGEILGKIERVGSSYQINSSYSSQILEKFLAYLNGSVDLANINDPKANFAFTVPKYAFQSNNSFLSSFVPDLNFSGTFELQGAINATSSGLSGHLVADVTDTNISQKKNKLKVSGFTLKLPAPDLTRLESGTSFISFDQAQFGDMHLDGGKVFFQLESMNSLLVEKSSLNWAGGTVDIMGTRIENKTRQQQITLYCNGLRLADILSQAGVSNVSGNGKVNGKIPLVIENGEISFENAFLYSTPGTGGTIQVKNSAILLAGIPKDTLQYSQLDFAGEALKDFKYKWVTLDLKSEGENAILAMKLDGKPASALPFQYNVNAGSFIRLPQGNQGIDYPIVLDVNFHLPLNKIINYGKNLKDLF